MEIQISLTDFVDYISKSGSPKMTLVRQLKAREDYHPVKDYYRILRDGLEEFHIDGKDKRELDKLVEGLNDKSKQKNYEELILAYKGFLGKKKITWFAPPFKHWKNNDLMIRLNPELGLEINGQKHIIKLYFKSDPISRNRVDLILTLLSNELKTKKSDFKIGLLDIRAKKLYTDDKLDPVELLPLLIGEAVSLETIWKKIK